MKTRLHLLLALILFCISQSYSQNFAPLNTTWHYQDYRWDCSRNYFIKVQVERDTMIDDKYVTILEVYNNENHIPEGRLYIYEEDNRVFFYEEEEFKILYDFNLSVGDTLLTHIPRNRTFYDFSCTHFDLDDQLISYKTRMIIDSINYSLIDGQELKTLYTRPDGQDMSNDCFVFEAITERIGCEVGLCGYYCTQCVAGCHGHLRCYSDNLVNYHPAVEDCEFILNSVHHPDHLNFVTYPNPTSSSVYLNDQINANQFTLYNTNGKKVLSGKVDQNEIQIGDLNKGLYILVLYDSQQEVIYSNRIVKE